MKANRCTGVCETCGKCKGAHLLKEMNRRKTELLRIPEGFQGDDGQKGYGIAFDIGTTTLVGILWDLEKSEMIDTMALTNTQNEFGSDVISRIQYCGKDPEKIGFLQKKVLSSLDNMIEGFVGKNSISPEQIQRITVDGNTTMSHIFAGYDPMSLALAPFEPAYEGMKKFTAEELGVKSLNQATVTLLPNIAGHVGGDITAGIIATDILQSEGVTVFIDIGTNGEIVVTKDGKALACSTAAGPAFEGASIYQGMRAAAGAIERAEIRDDFYFKTIENFEPVGICGSGLINIIGELVKSKIINQTGKLLMKSDLENSGLPDNILNRLRIRDNVKEFVLVFKEEGEDIVLTQKDIREVQLAKGAIHAGIRVLLKELDSSVEEVEKLIIAGAFGNFINKESAITIGLLPSVNPELIESVGNSAGAGTSMVLMSKEKEEMVKAIPGLVEHVELSYSQEFQDEYMKAMAF